MKTKHFAGLRAYFILWGSQCLSTLGTAMSSYSLIIWLYEKQGTASSLALLSVFSLLPSILFSFLAGAIADRFHKKRTLLLTDALAALGTCTLLILHTLGTLVPLHLYIISFLLSFMNAFQSPAAYVATSLLVPREQYIRVSGMQSFSKSIITVLAPALGSAILAFGGLQAVLLIDLFTFAIAYLILLGLVKIPAVEQAKEEKKEPFGKSILSGLRFLKERKPLFHIILFFAFINFIAKMGGYGMLPAFILGMTGNDQRALGLTESAVGMGTLIGGLLVMGIRLPYRRTTVIFLACGLSFLLGDVGQSLSRTLPLWIMTAFLSNVPLAFLNANLTAIMRIHVPLHMQGRVFSARDTLQYSTIPAGLFLGGFFADHVLSPLMASGFPVSKALTLIFGNTGGSGMAIQFFMVGMIGFLASMAQLKNPLYRALDGEGTIS